MATTNTPIFPQKIVNGVVQILPATTTTSVTVYAGGANGSKIENILVSSTDTSARSLQFTLLVSATSYIISEINIPANSGNTTAIPPVSILGNSQFPGLSKDTNGNPYLYLASGVTLQVNSTGTITTAKVISIISQGGDY